MIPMLGLSIAMLLAFRTNRGFERYWQGATQWTVVSSQLRNLSRIIWNGIAVPTIESKQEKIAIMKLLYGFAIAVKLALRGENAFHSQEFLTLLPPHLSALVKKAGKIERDLVMSYKFSLIDIPEPNFSRNSTDTQLPPSSSVPQPNPHIASDKPSSILSPEYLRSEAAVNVDKDSRIPTKFSGFNLRNRFTPSEASSIASLYSIDDPSPNNRIPITRGSTCNAPFDIIHRISYYLRRQRAMGTLEPEDAPSVSKAIETIIDALTKFEQLLYIPVPKSYDAHMKQVLFVYFLALPFQLVKPLGWYVVIVSTITSFAFFGADAIAGEIEDPFGNSENDLPIDYFCQQLKEDIEYIMEIPNFLGTRSEDSKKDV